MRHPELRPDDISEAEAKRLLDLPSRPAVLTEWWGAMTITELMHEGKWKRLARTDLKDDIRTLPAFTPDTFREMRLYGGRVTDDAIYMIDCWSDG